MHTEAYMSRYKENQDTKRVRRRYSVSIQSQSKSRQESDTEAGSHTSYKNKRDIVSGVEPNYVSGRSKIFMKKSYPAIIRGDKH
ncbi:hypothetical protein COD11_24100 [Bacillus sp. AFS040349]|nr:hypothetical protein COD11_24100 [Bacillus sp. AFS040349]